MTAFDRCPPTFSDDVLDRDIFPTPSADYVGAFGGAKRTTWEEEVAETNNQELAVMEDNMSNEWTMFSDPSFENRTNQYPRNFSKHMGAMQRDVDNDNRGKMENGGFGEVPKNDETARLVSPEKNASTTAAAAAAAAAAAVLASDADLSAWGLTNMENGDSLATKKPSTTSASEDVFGANFFGSGFDDDDGFFGNSDWTSPKGSTNNNNNGAVGGDADADKNDPWGQIEVGVSPFEGKKDEDTGSVVFTNMTLPDPITPNTEPTFSHPLKRQQNELRGKTKNEVVVSFEDYNHEIIQSPSNSSFSTRPNGEQRNASSEKSNRPPSTTKGHRRMSSYESQGSKKGHRRINSNGSQGSRRRSKGGGSIGSNSSAVDQILEHYRQKRLAKQNGGKASSATSSTVSSTNHRSIPSIDSLSSVPSSNLADAAIAAPAAAALSIMHIHKGSSLNDTMTSSLSSSSRHVSSPPLPTNRSNNAVVDWPDDDGAVNNPPVRHLPSRNVNKTANVDNVADQFLMSNIEATIGPRGSAPDVESLNGRSYNRSPRLRNSKASDSQIIDSRTSRNSRYSFRTSESNRSSIKGVNSMSPESKSVANDLFRLEAQLKEVARQQQLQNDQPASSRTEVPFLRNNSSNDMMNNDGYIGAEPIPRQNPIIVTAPPGGKLGILLLNSKVGGVSTKPTHVSAVRSESVLAGKVQVGDQVMKIDGEDVSQCNSKQIMAIMAAKSEYERVLEFRCLQPSDGPQEWI